MATLKQRLVMKKIIENHGDVSKSMIEAGYSPNTAISPRRNLTSTKGFNEVANEYRHELLKRGIDGIKLAEKMQEWLNAKKIFTSHTEPDKLVPDYSTQLKAGEMLREDFGLTKANLFQQINNLGGEMDIEFTYAEDRPA